MARQVSNEKLLELMRTDPGLAVGVTVTLPERMRTWLLGPALEPARSKGARVQKLIRFYLENHKEKPA